MDHSPKPISKTPQANPFRAQLRPKRIILQKEKDQIESFILARKDPAAFALENKGLIGVGIAAHNLRLIAGVSKEDLDQECFVSLTKSAKRWFPPKGAYSTFAVSNMRDVKRILEETHCNLHFPSHIRADIMKYRTWRRYNPEGKIEDFAKYLEIPVARARQIEEDAELHKNARVPKDGSTILYGEKASSSEDGDRLVAPYISISRLKRKWEHFPNPVSAVEEDSLKAAIRKSLGALTNLERAVVEHRFGLNGKKPVGSNSEVGRILGLTSNKAQTLFSRGLRKLREEFESRGLDNYLGS